MSTTLVRPNDDALLAPREVAEIFNVTPKTVGRWGEAGHLPMQRTKGGHRRFPAGPVYELLATREGVGVR